MNTFEDAQKSPVSTFGEHLREIVAIVRRLRTPSGAAFWLESGIKPDVRE